MAVAAGLAIGLGPGMTMAADSRDGIPYRELGRTGEKVSIVGLGGWHIGAPSTDEESIRIIRAALDGGINFLDNCWDYHEGLSETRMGKALRDGYRAKAFLMTKFDGRTRKAAAQQIDESLKRLQTDCVDLLQIHEVIRMSDVDRVFEPGGAMEAVEEARKAGKFRYFGFTGHKSPDIFLKMLHTAEQRGVRFDTVQMPLNVMDAHFNSFQAKVLPVLLKQEMGVLGMKPLGAGDIPKSKVATAEECLNYALSLPTSVVITGCDSMKILDQALGVAKKFRPMGEEAMASLLKRTESLAADGKLERYKTAGEYDSTAENPGFLG